MVFSGRLCVGVYPQLKKLSRVLCLPIVKGVDQTPFVMAPSWVYRDALRFSVAECQAAEAQPLMPTAPAAVLAIEAQHSAILAARSHGQTHAHHHTPANAYPGMPVHEPPPTNTLGFAEDAAPGMSREGSSVEVKPAPRLTVLSVTKSLIAGGVAGGV